MLIDLFKHCAFAVRLCQKCPGIQTEPSGDCRKYLPLRTCSAPLPGTSGTGLDAMLGTSPGLVLDDDALVLDGNAASALRIPQEGMPPKSLCYVFVRVVKTQQRAKTKQLNN